MKECKAFPESGNYARGVDLRIGTADRKCFSLKWLAMERCISRENGHATHRRCFKDDREWISASVKVRRRFRCFYRKPSSTLIR